MWSRDNIMNVVSLLFQEILFGLRLLTTNVTFTQTIKLIFGCNRFGKRTVYNLQTRIHFLKKTRDLVDKITDQLHLSKCIPNVSFKFKSCQKNCKWYVVMSHCNWRTCRCLKFKIGISKSFYWNLNLSCKISLKNSGLLWRYKQNADWISTKWNISTK